MSERNLRLVSRDAPAYEIGRPPESLADRARRLHVEAQLLACEEVDRLRQTLKEAVAQATEIRDGGDIFAVGIREQARQLAANLPSLIDTLQALSERRVSELARGTPNPLFKRDRGANGAA